MTDVLGAIVAGRHRQVAAARQLVPVAHWQDLAATRPRRDFWAAVAGGPPGVVAEFKRRSPSRGDIALTADPAVVAAAYARGGAVAVSVLTEPVWFGGSLDDLWAVRSACSLPVLAKDFIVDAYQVWQARAAGADAALLIVAAVGPNLAALVAAAGAAGVEPLVEVHTEAELAAAVDCPGVRVIGVNSRDLKTLTVDPGAVSDLVRAAARTHTVVAESGFRSRTAVAAAARAGARAVLVGEYLMASADPAAAVADLAAATDHG